MPETFPPVSPLDVVNGSRRARNVGFNIEDEKQAYMVTRSISTNSSSSSTRSLKTPRTARFAEATTVHSPATAPGEHRSPFAYPPRMAETAKPSDIGFGYISEPVEQHATVGANSSGPLSAPLKSALKTPGMGKLNPLSPTFREEQILEKEEEKNDVSQAKDLKIKTRVRMAKMILRGTNFSCSLIVLSMLSTTFSIFNATKNIPKRNNLPPWASGTNPWPQIALLCISCVSLAFSVFIFYAYWRGGHKRAQKTAVYYTLFAVAFFMFSVVMWAVGAGILHVSRTNGNGQDLWGWSCKDNRRSQLFSGEVHYALVCRMQSWSLVCCLIEVVVETITISIYAVVFYRFYSKNRLRKSMETRDRARSDLYLAQLRTQSAPNTPGFIGQTPRSARFPVMIQPQKHADVYSVAEEGGNGSPIQYAEAIPAPSPSSFKLQAPPIRVHYASPRPEQQSRMASPPPPPPQSPPVNQERFNQHVAAAPGEQTYDAVPIPGAYASPLTSPAFPPPQSASLAGRMEPGQAY